MDKEMITDALMGIAVTLAAMYVLVNFLPEQAKMFGLTPA